MFGGETLKQSIKQNKALGVNAVILAEWNMNIDTNISAVGNYRNRPFESGSPYFTITNSYDENDFGGFYTGATDADVVIDGAYEDDVPVTFLKNKDKEKILFSLEDCFTKFRPRSGINKARYFSNNFLPNFDKDFAQRPRYYMPDKNDKFKYWTSYRTENGIERGISYKRLPPGGFAIDDAAPFVVYKDSVPTNRIVVKMQTHVASETAGSFYSPEGNYNDPFYGYENSSIPKKWKIQYLQNNSWIDALSFNEDDTKLDGSPIVAADGHIELAYGLMLPAKWTAAFKHIKTLASSTQLPEITSNFSDYFGNAYLVKESSTDRGMYYVFNGSQYESFVPTYGWYIAPNDINLNNVSYLVDPMGENTFYNSDTGQTQNREFLNIYGLRIVVDSMIKNGASFELIELSPRLLFDISERVTNFSVNKIAADLGSSGLPVGGLMASNGSINIFDYDNALNPSNAQSVLAPYVNQYIKFRFYEALEVSDTRYAIPIKVLYSDGFPKINSKTRNASMDLRDLFFILENNLAPEIILQNASLSTIVSMLLDNIGFSNYGFRRASGTQDPVIPYFYVPVDMTVAEVLNELAIATQSAMFFDENNNFIVMTKEYLLPSSDDRKVDYTFDGMNSSGLSDILDIASQQKDVFNDGSIQYNQRYIQRSYGTIDQAMLSDRDKFWIYKPVLLWEVSGTERTKSINNESGNQGSYVLSAIPLNVDLSSEVPTVVNGVIKNNTMSFGDAAYWMSRYSGFFYANGEVISYDAVEYNVAGYGDVWITSSQEYEEYFSQLPFNGKIYPTGRVRIFSEPYYDELDGVTVLRNGPVAKHGRGQFGTPVVYHPAGLQSYWYDNDNVRGCQMSFSNLVNKVGYVEDGVTLSAAAAGVANNLAQKSTRNGIIKNFLAKGEVSETETNKLYATDSKTSQSSALVFNGPSFGQSLTPKDYVSYVYKNLDNKYRHFGTRMRIIGKIDGSSTRYQTPNGVSSYFNVESSSAEKSVTIGGSSGGLAVLLDKATNCGYYFEIAALTADNVGDYDSAENIHNIMFYKVMADQNSNAVPVKLWGGLTTITVDNGTFVGQSRRMSEENPSVYDLAVEYETVGSVRKFYLYINNKLIAIVDDESPLPIYNNMALFVRGSSRCMFENIYAITGNYAKNNSDRIASPVNTVFSSDSISSSDAFRKYAISGAVQSTYLSELSPSDIPGYSMYYDEFGTIMREAGYFNIRYDKAYPALYAKISPTFNKMKGYTISGFRASAYGAEFMVFNATDSVLSLDETSGNYLRIQGVTFTQGAKQKLTVDDYFNNLSDFSSPERRADGTIISPLRSKQDYFAIKNSRATYGSKGFSLDSSYIQSKDAAEKLMSWMIDRTMKPRLSASISVFGGSIVQLGDIVKVNSYDNNNNQMLSDKNFVVYNIDYSYGTSGPSTILYLSEVI